MRCVVKACWKTDAKLRRCGDERRRAAENCEVRSVGGHSFILQTFGLSSRWADLAALASQPSHPPFGLNNNS